MTDSWAIIEYERGRHTALPNGLGRFGIASVIPMVTEYSRTGKAEYLKPALVDLAFIPCIERLVRLALETVRYVEDVWRHENGELMSVPDAELQAFLDGLLKREKRPVRAKKALNLGAHAESDWFALYAHLYGLQAAIKRFGKDVREAA